MSCEQRDFSPSYSKESQDRLLLDTLDLPRSGLGNLRIGLQDLGLKEWNLPVPGPYTSLYFYTREGETIPFSIRARAYGVPSDYLTQGDIVLNPDRFFVLEIKKRIGDHDKNTRREIKYRQTTRLGSVLAVVQNLDDAPNILRQSRADIPLGYPSGSIPPSIFEEIKELGVSLEPAFSITSRRDHWVADEQDPDRLRITVDRDYFYHIVAGEADGQLIAHGFGICPWVRSEIKITDQELSGLAEDVRQVILENGGFPPLYRGDAKRLYLERKFRQLSPFLPSTKAFSYELRSGGIEYEMEGKISLAGDVNPELLIVQLRNMFTNEYGEKYDVEYLQKRSYGLNEVDSNVRYTITEHFVYGADFGTGALEQAFFITLNPSRLNWVGVKRKSHIPSNDRVLLRTEERIDTPFSVLNQESLNSIVEGEKTHLGVSEVFYLGRFKREKWRFFVRNDKGRVYIVALDRCRSGTETLHQVEIEYCLRRGVCVEEVKLAESEVRSDIAELMDLVVSKLNTTGIRAESTSQTKFQWLSSLHKDKE